MYRFSDSWRRRAVNTDMGFNNETEKPLVMSGREAAEALTSELKLKAGKLRAGGIVPTLAVIRSGEAPSDLAYERGAEKRAEKIGIEVRKIILPENASENEVLDAIETVNRDASVHGCLMFRPLKNKDAERKAVLMLDPRKDADGMSVMSQASIYNDGMDSGFAPCTAEAAAELIKYYKIPVEGKHAVVIGRSQVIGKPISMLLLKENATVTVCHSKTRNLRDILKNADIIIAAAGHAGLIDEDMLSGSQTVIDVGINVGADGKICGDIEELAKERKTLAYTPVPGGVGAMTSTVLMKHVIEACERAVHAADTQKGHK